MTVTEFLILEHIFKMEQMTQRELTLQKHLEDINLHESVRDAIHDAMMENAIEFAKFIFINEYKRTTSRPDVSFYKNDEGFSAEQLYNKFNLNKNAKA